MTQSSPLRKALSAASFTMLTVLPLALQWLPLVMPSSAQAQESGYNRAPGARVTQLSDNADSGEIVLKTESRVVAGRPQFTYMPGVNGDTVLTADFPGLSWSSPTKIIRLNSSEKALRSSGGIKEIHIGQFQISPSILRISFIAHDPAVLKKVAIGAAPGVLKLSWTQGLKAPETAKLPPKAPAFKTAQANRTLSDESDQGQPDPGGKAVASAGWLSRLKNKTKGYFGSDDAANVESEEAQPPLAVAPHGSDVAARATKSAATAWKKPAPASFHGTTKAESNIAAMPKVAPAHSTVGGVNLSTDFGLNGPIDASSVTTETSSFSTSSKSSPTSNITTSTKTTSIETEFPTEPMEVAAPPPLITLSTADGQGSGMKLELFRVERPDGKQLSFKSFRLHNPERYVLDMPDYHEMADAILPDVSQSPLVSSIRVGAPGEEGAGRLVLQLEDDTVSVEESYNSGSNYMTVTLGKGTMANAGISRTSSVATPAPIPSGPIVVPRAPHETVIVLDAGHGGSDPGAVRGDVQEKEVTMQIIAKVKRVLESKGARIVLTRSDDTFVSLEDRVKITNAVNPNLFLSVHINSLESTSNIYGIETYFQTDRSRPLADRVHLSLVSGLGAPDRSVRKARFYVINHTPVPAILAEVGYITNKAERDRLISSDYQQKVASALARGVMLYLNDVKSQSDVANYSYNSVGTSEQVRPSKLATGSWKTTK